MIRATYLLIAGDARMNAFMKAADLFEEGKVLGEAEEVIVNYAPDTDLTLERAALPIQAVSNYNDKTYIVSLFHLISIEKDDVIIKNNGKIKPYINPAVRIISSGGKWFMLDDYLKYLGFKVATDEFRYIKEVS